MFPDILKINLFNDLNSFILSVLVILLLILFYLIKTKINSKSNLLFAQIPGPPVKYPLIGNIDLILSQKSDLIGNKLVDSLSSIVNGYYDKGLFKLSLGPKKVVVVFRKDHIENLLKNNLNLEKSDAYNIFVGWLGRSLPINSDISLWKKRRNLLNTGFHLENLKESLTIINEKSNILIDKLTQLSNEGHFDICQAIDSCALDIICETALGFRMNCQEGQSEYLDAVHSMNPKVMERMTRPWLWSDFIYFLTKNGKIWKNNIKYMHTLSRKIIIERKQQILNELNDSVNNRKPKNRLSLLDLMLDFHLKDSSLTLEDIREEVDAFLLAGHETSAIAICWTLYFIGLYPDIQTKIQNELDSFLCRDQDLTMDQINKLSYLDAVIKETMRLIPPAPVVMRKITNEYKSGEYTIPKGVQLFVFILGLHMDPEIYEQPTQFRPERFLVEKQLGNENSLNYIPFSAGPRNCIGQRLAKMEIKVILAKILLNLSFQSIDSFDKIIKEFGTVTRSKNGFIMKISPRKL